MSDNQILTQGWLTYQSRPNRELTPLLAQIPEGKADPVFVIQPEEFDVHPYDDHLLEHVVDIRNHQFLKAIDLKLLVRDWFLAKKWLKGKKVVVMVVE